jgi:hypothetical protein
MFPKCSLCSFTHLISLLFIYCWYISFSRISKMCLFFIMSQTEILHSFSHWSRLKAFTSTIFFICHLVGISCHHSYTIRVNFKWILYNMLKLIILIITVFITHLNYQLPFKELYFLEEINACIPITLLIQYKPIHITWSQKWSFIVFHKYWSHWKLLKYKFQILTL